ncbi:hypothetical protein [Kiloniella laminariae]|uniref:hypothetical protein n=1 Tax=Kiloniella laminariae TaxID=454162 RepID=UPI00037DF2A1|nr:hypothetical protein [Kiloniella laminariae]
MIWFVWDLAPEFIQTGPWKNQGYADKFLDFFIKHLPEYEHSVRHVNIPRWSREVLLPNRCSAHLWGGFFPDQLLLSKPYSFTPPHVAIFHKRHQARIGPQGTMVSLAELLQQNDLTLVIMPLDFNDKARQSRYPVLYPYLAPYVGKVNLMERNGSENTINLALLGHGRADYTLGYPSTITTQKRINNLGDDYIAYRIKEHNLYKNVYVACKNDDFGKEVIEKVNRLLTEEILLKFLAYHEEWNDKDVEFRRTTIDYFIDKKKLANVIQ